MTPCKQSRNLYTDHNRFLYVRLLAGDNVCSSELLLAGDNVCSSELLLAGDNVCSSELLLAGDNVCSSELLLAGDNVCSSVLASCSATPQVVAVWPTGYLDALPSN